MRVDFCLLIDGAHRRVRGFLSIHARMRSLFSRSEGQGYQAQSGRSLRRDPRPRRCRKHSTTKLTHSSG